MSIRLEDLKPATPAAQAGTVAVIVKVRKPGYLPAAVRLRARIDDFLFTADVPAEALAAVERDPQVVSVAANQKLRIVD